MKRLLDAGRWAQVSEVFDGVITQPAEDREAFLLTACGDDAELLREVRSLLDADRPDDPALERGFEQALVEVAAEVPEPVGSTARIGRYRVVSEIGQGGMGAVFLAERDDDFRQRVAIKVVRGVVGSDGLRRFRAERQILASLNHANIAQLIDGGTTTDGLPYLVMEHVDGVPIDRYCEARALTVDERLELFCRVAEAVGHAHRSLVVHRDLKPSNILVTTDGVPKLLDFGIAKMLDESPDAALQTAASMRLLTPEYASPEQVHGDSITTATDIYSLGVLLFELLTGKRPYELATRRPEEIGRVVCTVDAPRPSSVVEPRSKLSRELAGDLDTIVLTALQKEPGRRYASAGHFVEDVKRYQEGLPVKARPSTWRYRSARFVRRHRAGVAVGAVIAIVVVGFTIALGFAAARAARERNTATRVTALLVEMFGLSGQSGQGASITASELLERGTERIRRELGDQPDLQAQVLDAIGTIYISLGLPERAQLVLQDSAAARSTAGAIDSLDRARTLGMLADALRTRGQYAAAEPIARASVAMGRRVAGSRNPQVAQWANTLGLVLHELGKDEEAEALFVENAQIFRDTLAPEHPMVAQTLFNTAIVRGARGDLASAERLARDALAIRGRVFGAQEADSLQQLAAILMQTGGRSQEAETLLREAVATRHRAFGAAGHPTIATTIDELAAVLRSNGKTAEADELEREANALRNKR